MLIACPECGKTISDQSYFCIGCGMPFASYDTIKKNIVEENKVVELKEVKEDATVVDETEKVLKTVNEPCVHKTSALKKSSTRTKQGKITVNNHFKEQDPEKRNEKLLEIIIKTLENKM